MQVIEEKREKRALLHSVTEVKPDDELKLISSGFTRLSSPSELMKHHSTTPWSPFTSRDLSTELRRRYTILTRMRRAVLAGQIPPSSSRPSSPRLQAFTPAGTKTTLAEPDELTQILWTCYLMLLENGQCSRKTGELRAGDRASWTAADERAHPQTVSICVTSWSMGNCERTCDCSTSIRC